MNKEAMLKVADAIEFYDRFDLAFWVTEHGSVRSGRDSVADVVTNCNTTACVAGWAAAVLNPHHLGHVEDVAADLLGLTRWQADALFYGASYLWGFVVGDERNPISATAVEAAKLLRALVSGEATFD